MSRDFTPPTRTARTITPYLPNSPQPVSQHAKQTAMLGDGCATVDPWQPNISISSATRDMLAGDTSNRVSVSQRASILQAPSWSASDSPVSGANTEELHPDVARAILGRITDIARTTSIPWPQQPLAGDTAKAST